MLNIFTSRSLEWLLYIHIKNTSQHLRIGLCEMRCEYYIALQNAN